MVAAEKVYFARIRKEHEESAAKEAQTSTPTNVIPSSARQSFVCPTCNRSLSSAKGLHDHIENIHERKTRFTCKVCGEKFYFNMQLTDHIARRHVFVGDSTSNQLRPFNCEKCQKRFKTRIDLKAHQKCHSSEENCSDFLEFSYISQVFQAFDHSNAIAALRSRENRVSASIRCSTAA